MEHDECIKLEILLETLSQFFHFFWPLYSNLGGRGSGEVICKSVLLKCKLKGYKCMSFELQLELHSLNMFTTKEDLR